MRVVVTTRQIGHYHDARYQGAAGLIDDLTVISVANEGAFGEFLAQDIRGYQVERLYPNRKSYDDAAKRGCVTRDISDKLDTLLPDVVAIAGWATPESFAAIGWARRNQRGIVMMSESQAFDASRNLLREAMKARIVRLCHAGLVGGPSHRDYLARLGIAKTRIFLGYNAVGNDHFSTLAAKVREDPDAHREALGLPARYILASARFIEKKNLPRLVRAYAKALKQIDNAPDLVILGDGPVRGEIENAVVETHVEDKVHLPGFRSYDLLPAHYGLAEGFVHVSLVEQWGLVINEAMASGTPVLASRPCGAAQALIEDGKNGFLVDPYDTDEIARGLLRLFKQDPSSRSEMCRAAQQTISNWGPQLFGEGLKNAAQCAHALRQDSVLRFPDSALLSFMSRRKINTVA